ncbi:uncharacterized protein SAPINGB_P000646 [Magnusiomyces paraingens]|uniref:Ty3 transposon capsid-like protein domain-containing protein n=1 Tax=Magnusiomyces paraingens TaxID=2606893 RepID=A0A5E8B7A7_9ASCO|nr:uncharacterized protein SAPINGB_P000646 [Saprochaete ingens]VVT45126.1 unnamed protein product [Saprochaete ingens]
MATTSNLLLALKNYSFVDESDDVPFKSKGSSFYAGFEGSIDGLDQRYFAIQFLNDFEIYMEICNVDPHDWPLNISYFFEGEVYWYAKAWNSNPENFDKTWSQFKKEFLSHEHSYEFLYEVSQHLRKASMESVSIKEFNAYVKTFRACYSVLKANNRYFVDNSPENTVNEFVLGLHPSIYLEWNIARMRDHSNESHIRDNLETTIDLCRALTLKSTTFMKQFAKDNRF